MEDPQPEFRPEPDQETEHFERRKMDVQSIGQLLFVGGLVFAVLGGLLMLLGRIPFLSRLGSLPGDIRIHGEGFSCFIPIVSMILISVLLTVVLNIILRLINR
jgi:hypothetical protein